MDLGRACGCQVTRALTLLLTRMQGKVEELLCIAGR